jgi:hypothetical protein
MSPPIFYLRRLICLSLRASSSFGRARRAFLAARHVQDQGMGESRLLGGLNLKGSWIESIVKDSNPASQ